MIKRISSGISGLDKLIESGFPSGRQILVSGGEGTGKTIFAMQFLYEGARKGEKCLYVTTEESPEELMEELNFFPQLKEFVKNGKITIKPAFPIKSSTQLATNMSRSIFEDAVKEINIAAGDSRKLAVSIFTNNARHKKANIHAHHLKINELTTEIDGIIHEGNDYIMQLTKPQVVTSLI